MTHLWRTLKLAARIWGGGRPHHCGPLEAAWRSCIIASERTCTCSYGPAPHTCFYKIPGATLGQSVTLPRGQWPHNFAEDPEVPGCGTFLCDPCLNAARKAGTP